LNYARITTIQSVEC